MQVAKGAGSARVVWLCAGVAGLALAAGAADAQAYYPDYPPAPQPSYQPNYPPAPRYDYPAQRPAADPRDVDPRGQDPRYADPRYQEPRYSDPRYSDPRYADPSYPSYQSGPAYPTAPAAPQDPRYADNRYADDRYADPRYQDPRYVQQPARAYRRRARDYGDGYANAYPPQPQVQNRYTQDPYAPAPQAAPAMRQPEAAPTAPAAPDAAPAEAPAAAPAGVIGAAQTVVPAPHLPHRLTEAAQAYADYMKRTCAIDAAFKSGKSVAEAVKTGAGYEAHQFEDGAIAYAALTALQSPEFVANVRQLVGGDGQGFADQLTAQPQAVLNIPGAEEASARAASALHRHGEHLLSVGAQVKQAAYDVQHSAWSKAEVSDPEGRLANAKVISAKRSELKGEDAPELTKAVLAEEIGNDRAAPSPVVTRALAIAALAVVGQLQSDDDVRLTALLAEPRSGDCLKMAKLNLFQCLSVSRPHYEDIFCLGQHAMMETGQCVVKAAGYTPAPVVPARATQTAGTSDAARK